MFIRRFKIDELPQLFNILLWEICRSSALVQLCRIRPITTTIIQLRRLLIRPGATGLAQVHGNVSIDWEETYKIRRILRAELQFHPGYKPFFSKLSLVIFLGEERFNRPFEETTRTPGKANKIKQVKHQNQTSVP